MGYWKFDEGTGASSTDSSGNGNNGSWNGTGNHWATGKIGTTGQFNGTSDYVSPGTSTNFAFGTGDFSWFSLVNPSQVVNQMLLLDTRNANPATGIYIYILNRYLNYYDYQTNHVSNYILSPNNWYHAGVVRNSGNTTFYVNGSPAGNFAHTTNLTTQKYYIGSDVNAGEAFFSGLIDDIRIYSRALSTAEIMALYNATK